MKLAVVGTGYVGLVTGACLASLGHTVACVDADPRRAELIARGEPPFHEPGLGELLRRALQNGRLAVVPSVEDAVVDSTLSILAVGTPSRDGRIDLGAIEAAAAAVGRALRGRAGYHVVVVKSTIVPGTTDTVVRRAVERAAGRTLGEFGLCMNPEFLREGSAVADFMNPDRIVLGSSDTRAAGVLAELYAGFDCPKLVTSLRNAEMIKYAANTLLATLVSYSNEIAAVCEAIPGLDEDTVMAGVHLDRRLTAPGESPPGIVAYVRGGIGFGGSCLPKDLEALRGLAAEHGVSTPLLDAVGTVNRERPRRIVGLLETVLGGLDGRAVAVLGLAFKPGTDDVRDSPALAVIRCLRDAGAMVRAYDPLVRDDAGLGDGVTLCSAPAAALADADAALIATAWPEFQTLDWGALTRGMRRRLLLDGRNVLRHVRLPADTTYLPTGLGAPAASSGA
jgi:UDPglucose 6-dehydrogenase